MVSLLIIEYSFLIHIGFVLFMYTYYLFKKKFKKIYIKKSQTRLLIFIEHIYILQQYYLARRSSLEQLEMHSKKEISSNFFRNHTQSPNWGIFIELRSTYYDPLSFRPYTHIVLIFDIQQNGGDVHTPLQIAQTVCMQMH